MFSPHSLSNNKISLDLLPYGLTVQSLILKTAAGDRDLLVGPKDPQEHHFETGPNGRGFINQTVGRYANRLPSGKTEKDGIVLDLIENAGPGISLHGGKRGLDTEAWKLITRQSSSLFPTNDPAYPFSTDSEEAIYSITSPHGADGFPLTLEIEGLIRLGTSSEDLAGEIEVVLRAKIVEDGSEGIDRGTPINLTIHWGWNLASFDGKQAEDISEHRLYLDSTRKVGLTEAMLPTGGVDDTIGTGFDFTKGTSTDPSSHRIIGEGFPATGIDNCLLFDTATRSPTTPAVVLTSPDLKTSLSFFTNQSAVQMYTAVHFDGSLSRKSHHENASGEGYQKSGALFLEFHQPLATFLHDELIDIAGTDTILRPGEVYENYVRVEVRSE